jgi:hypothetical protein
MTRGVQVTGDFRRRRIPGMRFWSDDPRSGALAMLETLFAVAITAGVLAVGVPLVLCYLLARQVAPIRPLRMMLLVLGLTLVGGPIGLGLGLLLAAALQRRWRAAAAAPTAGAPVGLSRQWAVLVADAEAAQQRFRQMVDTVPDGPLRHSLREAIPEVREAVAEAHRLAERGSRTAHAHRDVLRALESQGRRRRRAPALPIDLERSLADATSAQHASAERLAAAAARDLVQLQLVVARLHELTAHGLELATNAAAPSTLPASLSIADRLSALRLATDEVEQAARV